MSPSNIKVLFVAGARPNFMKIAPLIHAAEAHNKGCRNGERRLDWKLVHTGQHYDSKMSQVFFDELAIPAPDFNLDAGSGSHAVQTANVMLRFEPVCLAEKPDWVVVVGDVNSTVACALVAAKLGIRVAHVEAGLRSFDRTMPEEINRLVTDSISDLLFTPSEDASEQLQREGVEKQKIRFVGNVMIDSLVANLKPMEERRALERLGLAERDFIYVTLHRPSNVDSKESLASIMEALTEIASEMPIVFPVHPRTRQRLVEFGLIQADNEASRVGQNFMLMEPLGYHDALALTRHARCILTDSGGVQEESTYFRTPCLTLRPNTERPVTISLGSNRLTTPSRLRADFNHVLRSPPRLGTVPPLWDGMAARRIVEAFAAV